MSIQSLFDYEALDVETRSFVLDKTAEIVGRIRRSGQDFIAIGEALIEVKQRLGHGRFGAWIEAEFQWAERTARNFMAVSEAFKPFIDTSLDKSAAVADLEISQRALLALASPEVPEEARAEAFDRASNGERIGTEEAEDIINRHKPPKKKKKKGGKNKRPTNGHASAATQSAPEKSKAERYRDHFLEALEKVDDLTRAVAAPEKHNGYGGLPAVLDMLGKREAIRLMGKAETLIERLERWVLQIKEHFGE